MLVICVHQVHEHAMYHVPEINVIGAGEEVVVEPKPLGCWGCGEGDGCVVLVRGAGGAGVSSGEVLGTGYRQT